MMPFLSSSVLRSRYGLRAGGRQPADGNDAAGSEHAVGKETGAMLCDSAHAALDRANRHIPRALLPDRDFVCMQEPRCLTLRPDGVLVNARVAHCRW